jgi:hypothetical protein
MTNQEASKMARTGTDQPEVIRENIKRQNMKQTKAPTMMPKNREDQVQWIKLMRRLNETKLSVDDRFNEPTTMIKIKTYLYNEDSVTFKSLRLVPIIKPLEQSHKYERASVGIKPHINRAFIQDIFHYLTITHDSDNLPPDISISQLQSATEEENTDDMTRRRIQPMMIMTRNLTLLLMRTAHTQGLPWGRTTSPRLTPSRGWWKSAV